MVALIPVMTYPQVFHLKDGVDDRFDPLLNTWALARVAHQLPIAPAHLFDANIFSPQRDTLAFSETLLVPAIAVAPVEWLGGGPIPRRTTSPCWARSCCRASAWRSSSAS